MALQFIIGRSGSGKSAALYEKIIKESLDYPRQNYILIVPDQFTLDTQKEVINRHPFHGTMNIDIVSFHRLAYKVFQELSDEPGVILEDFGKSMVLSRILGEKREELALFEGSRDKMGFIDELKSLLSEFYQYRVTREMLLEKRDGEKKDSLLYEKLSELALVMEEFERFMGQEYIVAEQLLTVLGERAGESAVLRDSVICLDGFTGFTPVQYELLEKLLPICRDMYVTVTMDEKGIGFTRILDYELFAVSKETVSRLREIAGLCQVPVLENWVIDSEERRGGKWIRKGRFRNNPELGFLEENLFRQRPGVYEEKTEALKVYQLADPEEEALFAARQIGKLVREKGYRYRDIAVVSGDTERYGMRLIRIFEDYRIPCFLDDTAGMRSHPLVECIRGLFALAEYDFHYESVCHYMKNGMSDIEKEDADALDNYLLASGVRGYSALSKEFIRKPGKMGEKTFLQAERARKRLLEEVGPLMQVFRKKRGTVREYLTALFEYMVFMEYEEKLEKEEKRFEEAGDFVLMKAYGQVYGAVLDLLDKVVAILGEEEMELLELQRILDAGLEEMELGVIPPGIDQVVIGDTQRTRLHNVKVVFFLGVNEGVVPKPAKGGGILSEMDRDKLKKENLSLAPGARQNTALEQFYLYLNLTKPEDALYLTLSKVDQEGKSIRPSYLIGRLKLLFPQLTMEDDSLISGKNEEENNRSYYSIEAVLPYVREGINRWIAGEASAEDQALLGWLFETEEGKRWIESALLGRFYTNEESPLSLQAAKAIYGLHLETSVTRLEAYGGCAFAHFLQYGLMLAERQRFQIRSADLGQILHKCLELFSREAKEREGGLRGLEDGERDCLVEDCLRRAVEDYGSLVFHSSARNEACIDRMERLAKRTVWALQKQIQKGDFEPSEFEWRFQSRKDLEAVRLKLKHEGTLDLMGIVDRIDYYEEDENLYLKIIDYKSGAQTFSLEDIYHGLSLQLVVYYNAAAEKAGKDQKKQVVPGGIFYFHIQDPLVEDKPGASLEEEMLDEFSMSGLALSERNVVEHMDWDGQRSLPVSFVKSGKFSAYSSVASREQFEALGSYVKKQLVRYGNEILDGNIAIEPYKSEKRTACDYCAYRGVCGFDPAFSGNRYRKLHKIKKDKIWDKIEEINWEEGR